MDSTHTLLYHGIIPLEGTDADFSKVPSPGHPVYRHGDIVKFKILNGEVVTGKITVVDAYGTFGQSEEPSYDIYSEDANCLYKHILESEIIERI